MATHSSDEIYLPLELLQVESGFNVRVEYGDIDELAVELLTQGQLHALRVRKDGAQYFVIDGHRRRRAFARALEFEIRSHGGRYQLYESGSLIRELHGPQHPSFDPKRIACKLTPAGVNDVVLLTMQLSANGGKPLTPLEKTLLVARLFRRKLTKQEVVLRTGLSRTHISNALTLQEADSRVLELVTQGKLSQRLALKVLRAYPPEKQMLQVSAAFARASGHGREKVLPKDMDLPTRRKRDVERDAPALFVDPTTPVESRLNRLFARVEGLTAVPSTVSRERLATARHFRDFVKGKLPLERLEEYLCGGAMQS